MTTPINLPPWWATFDVGKTIADLIKQATWLDPRPELERLARLTDTALRQGRRVDPYLYPALEYWRDALAAAANEGRRSWFDAVLRYRTVRLSALVGLEGRPKTGNPLAALPTEGILSLNHLHASVVDGLSVYPCVCDWVGLATLLESLQAPKPLVVSVEICVQVAEWSNAQFQNTEPKQRQQNQKEEAARGVPAYQRAHAQRTGALLRSRQLDRQTPPSPLVCIIDDLCNFARWGAHAPLIGLWHQGRDAYTLDRLDRAHSCWVDALNVQGQAWPTSIMRGGDQALSGAVGGRRLAIDPERLAGEASAYRHSGYLDPPPSFTHGSGVTDLICGPSPDRPTIASASGYEEERPEVMFVQLPIASVLDTSGGSLASHALGGILHAMEAAQPGRTVIVNLSYGSHGGPHDGSSLWDQALRELLDWFDGTEKAQGKTLHVVLPAGNGHRSRTHAHLHVSPSHPKRDLHWVVLPEDHTNNQLELWFPRGVVPKLTVVSPLGRRLALDRHGVVSDEAARAMMVFPPACAQSQHGTMALLSLGATVDRSPPIEIQKIPNAAYQQLWLSVNPPGLATVTEEVLGHSRRATTAAGVWKVCVEAGSNEASRDFQFHAWVMRGDASPTRRQSRHGNPGRQSYLLDPDGKHIDPHFTFNGIACLEHERLWVVGAMRRGDSSLTSYTASGPNRCSGHPKQSSWRIFGPSVVVPADESLFQPGLLVAGVMSGSRVRMTGTSIAAAAFTRRLYEHLAAEHPASTVALESPRQASRVSPSGNPFVTDADPRNRGECVRLSRTR